MKTKTISLYEFDELPEEIQNKAIRQRSDLNIGHDWWDLEYDNFHQLAGMFGFEVDLKRTYFIGFYHQGQGSSFYATADVVKLINTLKGQQWKETFPTFNPSVKEIPSSIIRITKLIEKGFIEFQSEVKHTNRESAIYTDHDTRIYSDGQCMNPVNVEKAIEMTEEIVGTIAEELNHFLFISLRDEYDYVTSRETVIETIKSNQYHFTANGRLDMD